MRFTLLSQTQILTQIIFHSLQGGFEHPFAPGFAPSSLAASPAPPCVGLITPQGLTVIKIYEKNISTLCGLVNLSPIPLLGTLTGC